MAASGPQHAKRALVKVLLTLAALYCLHVEVNRESGDQEVLKAFRRVALKAHPDKGGLVAHAQALNSAKEAWDKARKAGGTKESTGQESHKKGAPQESDGQLVASQQEGGKRVSSFGPCRRRASVSGTLEGLDDVPAWLVGLS
jgi:curved DNA-binding protein CbpA